MKAAVNNSFVQIFLFMIINGNLNFRAAPFLDELGQLLCRGAACLADEEARTGATQEESLSLRELEQCPGAETGIETVAGSGALFGLGAVGAVHGIAAGGIGQRSGFHAMN